MEGKVVDPPGAAEVGYGPVGELARQELADAARDSRIDRPAAPPMPDFKDAFAEIGSPSGSYLGPSWNGTSRSTEQGHPRRAPDALGAVLVSASRERGRLRVVECCRAVGAPHTSLDALVEQNLPAVASLEFRIRAEGLVNQAAVEQPELAAQLRDG